MSVEEHHDHWSTVLKHWPEAGKLLTELTDICKKTEPEDPIDFNTPHYHEALAYALGAIELQKITSSTWQRHQVATWLQGLLGNSSRYLQIREFAKRGICTIDQNTDFSAAERIVQMIEDVRSLPRPETATSTPTLQT